MSARAAGIPKTTHSSPPVPELIPLSKVLPMMGITFWCVWAAYTTTELPEAAASTMFLEVAAEAAEPPEVVALGAVFPEAMVPVIVFPEVAAHAAEPPEAAVLASAPCVVVAPINALSARHVTVEGTVDELSQYPYGTTVEPPEVVASAADSLEVSVVLTCEFSPCPVTAKEAICELSPCPVTVMEAVSELLLCSGPADGPISELSSCCESALEADCDLSVCIDADFELSVLPVSVNLSYHELSVCPGSIYESVFELSVCPISPNE